MQKNKIKFKTKNIENTVGISSAPSNKQINCKCVGATIGRPNSKGITLVALVITIIVMLLLIGVTVSTVLKGDLFNIAKKASVETRASMVEEKVAEWKSNKKIDEYLEENSNTQSLEELLNDLETQQLITNEERKEIEEKMQVKIGDKEIVLNDIPYGYVELEYLESTGTQWIDTEYIPNTKTRVEVDMQVTNWDKVRNMFFGSNDYTIDSRFSFLSNSGKSYFQWNIANKYFEDIKVKVTDRIYVIMDAEGKFLSIAGKEYIKSDINWNNLDNNTDNFCLFAITKKVQLTTTSYMRCYNTKIYESGLLKKSLIPCLDTNGTPCMYDTVTGQTFYNQGTGEFIAGYKN